MKMSFSQERAIIALGLHSFRGDSLGGSKSTKQTLRNSEIQYPGRFLETLHAKDITSQMNDKVYCRDSTFPETKIHYHPRCHFSLRVITG